MPDTIPSMPPLSAASGRRLAGVAGIGLMLFIVELLAGVASGSQALTADALDFLAAAVTLGLSFGLAGRPASVQAAAVLVKDMVLVVMGVWTGVVTLYRFLLDLVPIAEVMGAVGLLALAANLGILYLLRDDLAGATPRRESVRARNDSIGNVTLLIAAGLVGLLGTGKPDLVVAGVMVVLYLAATVPALLASWRHWQELRDGLLDPVAAPEHSQETRP